MKARRSQQGLSLSGIIIVLLMAGAATSVGLKLVPFYMDFNTIGAFLDTMAQENGMVNKRTVELKAIITKRLKMNNIRDFKVEDRMTIKRAADRVIIDLDYEIREPVVYNISLLLSFKKKVELRD